MIGAPDIVTCMRDPSLWRRWFDGDSWLPWQSFLKSLFALPMTGEELAIYQKCTAREYEPTDEITEAWVAVGRRGGKSLILALVAVYLSVFRDWTPYLSPGESGYIKIMAVDRR